MIKELLKTVTHLLDQKGIGYMISGSLALNVYCIPRMTMDIDIVIDLDQANLNDFLEIFTTGYYVNEDTVKKEISRKGMFNVIDHRSGLKIDFIIRKETEYRRLEFSRKTLKFIEDISVWMVSAEDLIISKIEWIQQLQSDKQIQDVKMLLRLPEIDRAYITTWCEKLKLKTFRLL
ncbi:MAG: nucleotidyl transferase AbiEii/AbiGii toxin family protein [Bacteroidales bacterium]|jgi:hypothetical protein|nr:nucleotidyl transferase AbiEii/AbiGii toxin family protein [Bacteroidales bacterium]